MDAIRAKIPIRDGSPATRKEHVNHYIGTLDDRELARMLAILRLGDADDLEETLQKCKNIEVEKLTPVWGRINFDSVLRHRRSKRQRSRPGL